MCTSKRFECASCSEVQRWRYPLQQLFFSQAFEKPLDLKELVHVWLWLVSEREDPAFSRFSRCYEACRWSPSSFNAQPVRVVGAEGADRVTKG